MKRPGKIKMEVVMVTDQQIHELLSFKSRDIPVSSFYLNTDLRYTTLDAIRIAAKDLVKQRKEEVEKGELTHEQKESLRRDFDRILTYVEDELFPGHFRGLVLFSSSGNDFWQVYPLPQRIKNALIIDPDPYIRPLLGVLNQYQRYGFLVIDKKRAQIFEWFMGDIQNITDLISEEVPGKIRIAGWYGLEEKRVMRHIDNLVHRHFKRVADLLFYLQKKRNFDYIILGGQTEVLPDFERHLHSYVLQKIVERVKTEPFAWDTNTIKQKIAEIENRLSRKYFDQLIDELITLAGKKQRGVLGLKNVLDAANTGNIRLLLLEEDRMMPGRECFNCGYLTIADEVCPVCGAATEEMDDLYDEIVESTVNYNGDFYQIPKGTKLAAHGGAGAFLRFNQ